MGEHSIVGPLSRDYGIYIWRSLTKPPNLNPPIFLQWRFGAQPPNLIPANISGYTVFNIDTISDLTQRTEFCTFQLLNGIV